MRDAACEPGYKCLKCTLPPSACDMSGPKVRLEEKQMYGAVGHITHSEAQIKTKRKDRSQ